MPQTPEPLDILDSLLQIAKRYGAEAADALLVQGHSAGVSWREGRIESLDHAEGRDLGLRVLIGKRQAIAATTDFSASALDALAQRAVAMARAASEDPYCGIADPTALASGWPTLSLHDDVQLETSKLVAMAKEGEAAALAVKGVSQCEGADAGFGHTTATLAATNGFSGQYRRTGYSISVSALAGEGTGMERDYDYASTVFFEDLPSPASIGKQAGERAVAALSPRKMPSCKAPVVFAPRVARELLGDFADAILGSAVARGTSFLKDSLGQIIFPETVSIIDDPHRARGLRSKPFDGEGLATRPRTIIEKGRLTSWLMDLRSARQLGMQSTGHASRGTSGVPSPSPTNLYMDKGSRSPEELIEDIKSGFYVTELMGMGVNGVTGDFSQAARGFWIENGAIAYPVSEMTVAGNLKSMFLNLTPASDLTFRYGIDAPTIRIEGMTIAGV